MTNLVLLNYNAMLSEQTLLSYINNVLKNKNNKNTKIKLFYCFFLQLCYTLFVKNIVPEH